MSRPDMVRVWSAAPASPHAARRRRGPQLGCKMQSTVIQLTVLHAGADASEPSPAGCLHLWASSAKLRDALRHRQILVWLLSRELCDMTKSHAAKELLLLPSEEERTREVPEYRVRRPAGNGSTFGFKHVMACAVQYRKCGSSGDWVRGMARTWRVLDACAIHVMGPLHVPRRLIARDSC